MSLRCRLGIAVYSVLYVVALGIAIVGTQGLFGTQPDGLAAVWLIFLGFPWTLLMTVVPLIGMPLWIGQVVIILAPFLNIWLFYRFCRKP